MKKVNHQFSLFQHKDMRPKLKVPISAAQIEEAKALFDHGDQLGAAEKLRIVREKLEDFEARITNKRKEGE
jgi:hypothetical protein